MQDLGRYNDDSLDTRNPAPRCPVILLLDTSSSMEGAPINELNKGLRQFLKETADDEAASRSVELEVISFNTATDVALPFTPVCDVDRNVTPLVAEGSTALGAAIRRATKDLNRRRHLYLRMRISANKPWVILMTDGAPNDDWEQASLELRSLGEKGEIQYIGLEIGKIASHSTMCRILPPHPGPLKLNGLHFKEFFRWLTDSLRRVSSSAVSDQENVTFGSYRSWGSLP